MLKNIKIILILICFMLANNTFAQLTETQQAELADKAGNLFRQANELSQTDPAAAEKLYDQSILAYQSLIDQAEIKNASLYYNIANAYLLKEDIGRAILNYRRAEQYLTNDADLAANLKMNLDTALSKRFDKVPIPAQEKVLQTLFFWHYDIPTQPKFILAGSFWAITCLFIVAWLKKRQRKGLLWTAVIFFALTFAFVASVALDSYQRNNNIRGVITDNSVIARQGDSQTYSPSFKDPLHAGTEFQLKEKRPQWYRIQLGNGQQAWIPSTSADLI